MAASLSIPSSVADCRIGSRKDSQPPYDYWVLRSLVTVRVSQINWCRFCVDINSATLLKRGASFDKVGALENWREADLFDERERVALEYAEAVTVTGARVTDDLMARVAKYFNDDAIVELTALIAFQNLSSKFNSALDVPAQGFCRLPGP